MKHHEQIQKHEVQEWDLMVQNQKQLLSYQYYL